MTPKDPNAKPMSLSQFRLNIFPVFKLMRDTRMSFDVYHRRKLYRVWIEETGERLTTPYKRRSPLGPLPTAMIDTRPCGDCTSLLVNGVCMNRACSGSSGASQTY